MPVWLAVGMPRERVDRRRDDDASEEARGSSEGAVSAGAEGMSMLLSSDMVAGWEEW